MSKRKTGNPTWSDVKSVVTGLNQKELLKLVADLYRFSKENKAFIHARFAVGDDPMAPYKKTIEASMYPDMYEDKPVQISKAKKAITSYSKAIGDSLGEIDLMVFFVECGNNFTVNCGDMDEGFYDALIRMYRRSIQKILSLPKDEQSVYKDRLEKIMTSASDIGWGYHDMLSDEYYSAFPEDE
ncbi:MAG: hypothetical protein JEZ11_01770 [Desulfobacterales bacterium]|nr:hypothetical protein [Desulfobacterales bacterium]